MAHIRGRLTNGAFAELGVRFETHGDTVMISGTGPSKECRAEVLRIAHEELGRLSLHGDVQVVHAQVPGELA